MLNIGIIGAGRMGCAHAGNLEKLSGVRITAVYDLDPAKSAAFTAAHPTATSRPSAAALAGAPNTELLLICSPTYCHAEGLRIVLKSGKPVFCEKPLCRTRAELDELAPLLSGYRNLFAIGFVRRYAAGTIAMKKMIDDGKIGRMLCGEVRVLFGGFVRQRGDWFTDYNLSGGVMLDMLAHHADLQNYFAGEPESIYANALMLDPKLDPPCDFVSATARYRNGYISNMECSWLRSGPSGNSLTIYGDAGALRLSDADGLFLHTPGKEEKIELDENIAGPVQEKISGNMYAREMAVLIDCLRKGETPPAGADAAVAAMNFCLGMMESAETGSVYRFRK